MEGRRPRRLPYFFMPRPLSTVLIGLSFILTVCPCTAAQGGSKPAASAPLPTAQQGLKLADEGHCEKAIPILRKAVTQPGDKDLKRRVGFTGLRCAMSDNRPDAAVDFLRFLNREFPHDPDVLYVSVHTYSDLSTWAAQELAATAPNSYQAHKLNAEALELQGKWDQAASEYKRILEQDPRMPGIHFLLARLLLSKPDPSPTVAEEAKKELQQEIEIDPSNAGAEYVLGELARQDSQWPDAIAHFTRATKLDATFGDAYLGLGRVPDFHQTIFGGSSAARDCGQAGAEKSGGALQPGHGLQSRGTQAGCGQGICHPSPDDGEEWRSARFAARSSA